MKHDLVHFNTPFWSLECVLFFSELYISKPTFVGSNKQEARRQVRLPQKARLTTYLSIQNIKPTVKPESAEVHILVSNNSANPRLPSWSNYQIIRGGTEQAEKNHFFNSAITLHIFKTSTCISHEKIQCAWDAATILTILCKKKMIRLWTYRLDTK